MCFFWLASASVASAQKTPCTYQKSLGKSGKQMKNPIGGYSMQAAHEDWNVIYCNPGTTIALHRNGRAFFTYARWYNYATDGAMTGLTCSDVRQYNENGGYANISSSTWSFATNELDKQVPAGYGRALGYAASSDEDATIRLPKPNTKYHYFKDGVWVTFSSSDIDRSKAGKPMFTPDSEGKMSIKLTNKENSEIFLFGNPTFAYIDLEKLMDAYNKAVATNPIKIAGFYTTGVDKDSRYQLAAKTDGEEGANWVSSVKSDVKSSYLLAPTEAVFIRFETLVSH